MSRREPPPVLGVAIILVVGTLVGVAAAVVLWLVA